MASGRFQVDGKPSRWVRDGGLAGRPLVLFAHGAGAPLQSAFMVDTARALDDLGVSVARFHFPYMERKVREGKQQPPDRPAVLLSTWRRFLALAGRWKDRGPLVLMGKSMGGRIASMMLAEGVETEVRGAVYLGYPLHPPGAPERLRAGHLPAVPVPQLFVQGARDALCQRELFAPVMAGLGPRAREVLVDGGDHSLARERGERVTDATPWLREVARFVSEVTRGPA